MIKRAPYLHSGSSAETVYRYRAKLVQWAADVVEGRPHPRVVKAPYCERAVAEYIAVMLPLYDVDTVFDERLCKMFAKLPVQHAFASRRRSRGEIVEMIEGRIRGGWCIDHITPAMMRDYVCFGRDFKRWKYDTLVRLCKPTYWVYSNDWSKGEQDE